MNIIKNTVKGIDVPIQGYQTYLYNHLKALWGFGDTEFNMYGRAYRNQTKAGYTPEVYVGGNEYRDVLVDDTLKGSAFWGVGETTQVDKVSITADAFVIFMIDLSKIKPNAKREDEAARIDVQQLCLNRILGFHLNGFVTGIDNVFREYSGWNKTEGIKYTDTHPMHCFRINLKLLYSII